MANPSTIFDRSPQSWTTEDVSQFLLLIDLPYVCSVFQDAGIDGATLCRLSTDDLTCRFHLPAHDAIKLLDHLTRMVPGKSPHSLLPGESIIPVGPTALPPPRLFQAAHVLPPATVATRQAQQDECASAAHYVPVLLPSDNPVGWRGSVYGEREDVARKPGTSVLLAHLLNETNHAGGLSKLLTKSVGLLRASSGAWTHRNKATEDCEEDGWGSGILAALYTKNAAVEDLDRFDSVV